MSTKGNSPLAPPSLTQLLPLIFHLEATAWFTQVCKPKLSSHPWNSLSQSITKVVFAQVKSEKQLKQIPCSERPGQVARRSEIMPKPPRRSLTPRPCTGLCTAPTPPTWNTCEFKKRFKLRRLHSLPSLPQTPSHYKLLRFGPTTDVGSPHGCMEASLPALYKGTEGWEVFYHKLIGSRASQVPRDTSSEAGLRPGRAHHVSHTVGSRLVLPRPPQQVLQHGPYAAVDISLAGTTMVSSPTPPRRGCATRSVPLAWALSEGKWSGGCWGVLRREGR